MTTPAHKVRLILSLRQGGITDTRILSAIERVPREVFVPEPFRDQAYEDMALPIGHGQTLSQPAVVARMLEALEVGERMKVLEVGTGSGYHTAVMARLCRRVYTIERHRPLLHEAEQRFAALGLHNVTTMAGDGMRGWPQQAPFDRISVTAAAVEPPSALLDQLSVGGIMVVPVGKPGQAQTLMRVLRTEQGLEMSELAPVRFVPLVPGIATGPAG